jgi:hypothetical protein
MMDLINELRDDIDYLARRAQRAGSFSCSERRDTGMSSNAIVSLAYGVGEQGALPSDRSDYAACVNAVRGLPRHRRTPKVMDALRKAKEAFKARYP